MIAGHTKFAPDRFFGIFKRKYRNSDVNSLVDVCVSVTSSSITRQNKIQLIADAMGNSLVTWYKWTGFLSEFFQPLPGITSYHLFRASHDRPGVVFVH